MTSKISAVIPARNEAERITPVLRETTRYVDEVIVVDDNSTDGTASIAHDYGSVIHNATREGYIPAIKKGFNAATHDVIVTLDADGEHDPAYIPKLVQPIRADRADLTLGVRDHITRPSERLINHLANVRVQTADCGTGYRAIRTSLARKLQLPGACTCGVFVLEAHAKGARIVDVPVENRRIDKPRRIAWEHVKQFFVVLRWLLN